MPARSVSWAISGANGVFSSRRTVSGSTTSTLSTWAISARRNEPWAVRCRSSENFTASAVIVSPSWNFTPGRSRIVTTLPSAEVLWLSASCGTMASLSSMSKSLSQIDLKTMRPT